MFYNIHTHKSSNQNNVLEIVNQYPYEFDDAIKNYSIGIHPWHIDENRVEADLKIIEEKLQLKYCLALGECGLDKRIEMPLEIQIQIFERQIALAKKYNKPLILHCVAAYQEVIEIKKRLNIKVPIIIHGFSKNIEVAKSLLDNGFYLSFGKYLLRNPELETVFKEVPNHQFFLETDTMDETLEEVYAVASKFKNITVENLEGIISDNFNHVFIKS